MDNILELTVAGTVVIFWFQLFRFTDAIISRRMVDATKTVNLSNGQTVLLQYSIRHGHEQIDLVDVPEVVKPETDPTDSPLPPAYNANPLLNDKRNAMLIVSLSKKDANFDKFATDILGVRDIDKMGHETWGRALDYMAAYHGVIKGKPGKLSTCGTDGTSPGTLDALQHSIRIHQPPAPDGQGVIH